MGIVRTLSRVLTGFVLACLTAAAIQVLYVSTPAELAAVPAGDFPAEASQSLNLALLAATQFAIFSLAFALIAAGIAEWLGLRGLGYWLAAGVGIALLGFIAQFSSEVPGQPSILNDYALQSYLTAGFFGGLVYWMFAGRRSGERHDAYETGDEQPAERPRIIVERERIPVKKGSLAERLALKRASSDAATAQAKEPVAVAVQAPVGQAATGQKPAEPRQPVAAAAASTAVPITKTDATARGVGPRADAQRQPGADPAKAEPEKTQEAAVQPTEAPKKN
ncbi:MAG: hypothetical protein ABL907_06580 [Hyphomicrobium sp.]